MPTTTVQPSRLERGAYTGDRYPWPVSDRAARAAAVASVARLPLELVPAAPSDRGAITACTTYALGLGVPVVSTGYKRGTGAVHVVVKTPRDMPPAPTLGPTFEELEQARSLYRRSGLERPWRTAAAGELLSRARAGVLELDQLTTVCHAARAIAALAGTDQALPEHVAEALSYRRPKEA